MQHGLWDDSPAGPPPAPKESELAAGHDLDRSVERPPFCSAPDTVKLSPLFKSTSSAVDDAAGGCECQFHLDARRVTFTLCAGTSTAIDTG